MHRSAPREYYQSQPGLAFALRGLQDVSEKFYLVKTITAFLELAELISILVSNDHKAIK